MNTRKFRYVGGFPEPSRTAYVEIKADGSEHRLVVKDGMEFDVPELAEWSLNEGHFLDYNIEFAEHAVSTGVWEEID